MKIGIKLFLAVLLVSTFASFASAQQAAVQLPRDSQRAEVAQTVGDARIAVVYHRPNTKGRPIWGCQTNDVVPKGETKYDCLVPYGQVWRVGANENTTFETSENVKINGQDLPAGKYGLHAIPGKDEWTIIFSKKNDEWGSFSYKQENDALRVKAKPETVANPRETMMIEFDSVKPTATNVVIEWEKIRVPFTVDVGDVQTRVLGKLRRQIAGATDGSNAQVYVGSRATAASFVLENKIKSAYPEAVVWINDALKTRETFGILRTRARLAAETGSFSEAVQYGEKALAVGRAAKPAVNADTLSAFESDVQTWRKKIN